MLMNIHKEITKNLSLEDVGDEFVSLNERRWADFGKFSKNTK